MLGKNRGKLVVYSSKPMCERKRLRVTSVAVEKTAKNLNLDVEFITIKWKECAYLRLLPKWKRRACSTILR